MKGCMRPEAVIFDMDGVIVDSMPYHFIAWYEALRPFGVRVNCFDVYTKEGERWDRSLGLFLKDAGVEPSKALMRRIFKRRQKIFAAYFKRYIFQGAAGLLASLDAQKYRLALVTGTPLAEVKRILPAKIRRHFDCIVAGDEVKKGKPHPEPYLTAAAKLGVAVERCVVVENAPYGITSAKQAGMFCVAVTTSLPEQYLRHADRIVNRLDAIPKILKRACRKQGRNR